MDERPTKDPAREIKRRSTENNKRALYFLIPFALTTFGAWAHAPRPLLIAGFISIWVGLGIWMVSYYRLSRCPVCNHFLAYLFQLPMLYRRCPYCLAPFSSEPSR